MKRVFIFLLVISLLVPVLAGQKKQRKLPELKDPDFESQSTRFRISYHVNKHDYTLYMPDLDSPIPFDLKFGFWTSSYTKVKFGKVKRKVYKRKFTLNNGINGDVFKVKTVVGDTEIFDFFYIPDKGRMAILVQDESQEKNIGIFYPDNNEPEDIFKGILKGEDYTVINLTAKRFGKLGTLIRDEKLMKRCRMIKSGDEVIAQFIKGVMRGVRIPFDLYIRNDLNKEQIAELMTLFICSHQLMLTFEDAND
jgi:hypothetical protein